MCIEILCFWSINSTQTSLEILLVFIHKNRKKKKKKGFTFLSECFIFFCQMCFELFSEGFGWLWWVLMWSSASSKTRLVATINICIIISKVHTMALVRFDKLWDFQTDEIKTPATIAVNIYDISKIKQHRPSRALALRCRKGGRNIFIILLKANVLRVFTGSLPAVLFPAVKKFLFFLMPEQMHSYYLKHLNSCVKGQQAEPGNMLNSTAHTFYSRRTVYAYPIQNKADVTGVNGISALLLCVFSSTVQFCNNVC